MPHFLSQILLVQSGILRTLISETASEYDEVATSWLIALAVIAVGWALIAFAIKWLVKFLAKLPHKKIWGRTKTIVYIFCVAVLLGATVALVWNWSVDFKFVVGVPGLFKGVFVAGVSYIVLMFVLHLFGDARHDLYY
jgi:hypothetical protein